MKTKDHSNLEPKTFTIQKPFLWLSILVLLLYIGSIQMGFTELDDTIFVQEFAVYNENVSNLLHSFKRGVFNEVNDTYYRPLLMNSFIVNYFFSETDIQGYHLFNILFHLLSVLLLYVFFKQMNLQRIDAFLLSALFAIHPVLAQAVVWIPGRNDTILAVFAFSFMIASCKYITKPSLIWIALQFFALLAALFTKETAVFVPFAFFILLLSRDGFLWKNKANLMLYASWIAAIGIWFLIRSHATVKNDPLQFAAMAQGFIYRFPLSIQYLGKIILPFQLSVFPMMADTSYILGIIALLLLGAGIYFSKHKSIKKILAGIGWYLFLLLPLFILPSSLNDQDFEHRLYLPIVGILLLIHQTFLFTSLPSTKKVLYTSILIFLFAVLNYVHQQKFTDAITFWNSAVATTPNSAYANMMLAARLKEGESSRADALMQKAYQLNPKERYVNYYLGKDYLNKNNLALAEKHLKEEINGSAYYESYFLLSRLAFMNRDTAASIQYMETFLTKDSANAQAINNYVLMLSQVGAKEKAQRFLQAKIEQGIPISQELQNLVR